MNDRARYRAVEAELDAHYAERRYGEGIALLRAVMPELPGWRADLAHSAACLLALAGLPDEALAELVAAFDAGAWWHRRILTEDDDLAPLRDLAGFPDLVERAHARLVAAAAEDRPPLVRRPTGPPAGLLVALHGAGEEAADAAEQWQAALDVGFVVVAVTSSQRTTATHRSWPDCAVGLRDIRTALAVLSAEDGRLPLLAAGFSAGGRQAIQWALAGEPGAPAGFLAVAPAIGPDHLDRRQVAAARRRGVSGLVVLGERDDDVRADALAAVGELRAGGVACRLDNVPGLGHAFPADFGDRLRRLLVEPGKILGTSDHENPPWRGGVLT